MFRVINDYPKHDVGGGVVKLDERRRVHTESSTGGPTDSRPVGRQSTEEKFVPDFLV